MIVVEENYHRADNRVTMNHFKVMWMAFYFPCHDADLDDDIRAKTGNHSTMWTEVGLP